MAHRRRLWTPRPNDAYFLGGTGPVAERFDDDGEPSGTAGAPILAVVAGEDLRDVLVVVTRYFGGTKLGTGGLARAYAAMRPGPPWMPPPGEPCGTRPWCA